jgi:transketolase
MVMDLGDLASKFESFGWTVLTIEKGNDIDEIVAGLRQAKTYVGKGKPIVILMKTEMGKGVDFMEGSHAWHGIAPNDEQLKTALAQLPETLGDY